MKRFVLARTASVFALALLVAGTTRAADFVPGLTYLRLSAEAGFEPDALAKALVASSVVLDLRQATDAAQIAPITATLKAPVKHPKRVIFVLLAPETSEAILNTFVTGFPGCITIGRTDATLKTDILVTTSADADQKSVAALGKGIAPEKLIIDTPDKRRFDESTLMKEHLAGQVTELPSIEIPADDKPATPTAPADPAAPSTLSSSAGSSESAAPTASATVEKPKPAPPLVDAVLLRAVQVHRGLIALKKL